MTRDRDLKRRVRSRMSKTGESYTSARKHVVSRKQPRPAEYAGIAGMSDDAVAEKTGYTWKDWVKQLDAIDATKMPHKDIAKYVHERYEISGWWAQMVTVSYERIRGLRDPGQRRGGTYDANKSKTFPVPISKLYGAFSSKRIRNRWLPDVDLTIRTSTKDKSMRITWPDDTSVHVYFTAKGADKSMVAIQHSKLPSKKNLEAKKVYWSERLQALKELLM